MFYVKVLQMRRGVNQLKPNLICKKLIKKLTLLGVGTKPKVLVINKLINLKNLA